MRSTDLSDHYDAALGVADELLELLPYDVRHALYEALLDDWDYLFEACLFPSDEVHAFLSSSLKQQYSTLDRMPPEERHGLWFQARFAALRAANALRLAADAQMHIPGNSARETLRYMSEAVSQEPSVPSLEDVLLQTPGW